MPHGTDFAGENETAAEWSRRLAKDREKGVKRKDGQSRQNVREDPPPAFNPHPGRIKKKRKNHGVEETVYGMKSSFHVGVKVGRRMGNEAQQRLAPGFGWNGRKEKKETTRGLLDPRYASSGGAVAVALPETSVFP